MGAETHLPNFKQVERVSKKHCASCVAGQEVRAYPQRSPNKQIGVLLVFSQ